MKLPPFCRRSEAGAATSGAPGRWLAASLFAVAMAWVEAAVVLYLRTLDGRLDPYHPEPLQDVAGVGGTEVVREFATLVMLGAVSWLAGRTRCSRFGYFVLTFGLWDIFYYVFLKGLTGWPRSVLDWDILFLLPLPWWGPVLAPLLIAGVMVAGGSLIVFGDAPDRPLWPAGWAVGVGALGVGVALYVFMADALRVVPGGTEALRALLPERFNWPLFWVAWTLMLVPLLDLCRQFPLAIRAGRCSP